MQPLSSSWMTVLIKRIFPVLWYGVLVFQLLMSIGHGPGGWHDSIVLLAMAIGGFVLFRFFFNFVDEVWLDGEQLLVKNRSEQWRIPLADIGNAESVSGGPRGPRRIELSLDREWPGLGSKVTYLPADSNSLDDLKLRIDALQRIAKYR